MVRPSTGSPPFTVVFPQAPGAQVPPIPAGPPVTSEAPLAPSVPPVPGAGGAKAETAAVPEPNVGWYASTSAGYSPPAGPYASAGPYAVGGNRGRGGAGRGRAGAAVGRLATWGSGRSKLLNAAIFGVAPLALAGIVTAAFVLSSAGKGQAAAQAGFHAGPAASVAGHPQGTGSTAAAQPSPSQGNPANQHGKKSKTAVSSDETVAPKAPSASGSHAAQSKSSAKPKTKPKPKPALVTPHNLGLPNFSGYCQHIGHGTAVTTANNAFGWHCSANAALPISIQNACAWTYGLSASKVIDVTTDYHSLTSWQCWRTSGILGQLSIASYCTAAGLGAATLNTANAYGWTCGKTGIDTNAACQLVYHNSNSFARFAVFANPYSWQCWD